MSIEEITEEIIFSSVSEFYKKHIDTHWAKLLEILSDNEDHMMARRTINWLITNYAKKNKSWFINKEGCIVDIYGSYRTILKAFQKIYFDPFGRWEKIMFYPGCSTPEESAKNPNAIRTTLCQLNFFKWALPTEIIDYCFEHKQEIEKDRKSVQDQQKAKRKRTELMKMHRRTDGKYEMVVYVGGKNRKKKSTEKYPYKRQRLSKPHTTQIHIDYNKKVLKI